MSHLFSLSVLSFVDYLQDLLIFEEKLPSKESILTGLQSQTRLTALELGQTRIPCRFAGGYQPPEPPSVQCVNNSSSLKERPFLIGPRHIQQV